MITNVSLGSYRWMDSRTTSSLEGKIFPQPKKNSFKENSHYKVIDVIYLELDIIGLGISNLIRKYFSLKVVHNINNWYLYMRLMSI